MSAWRGATLKSIGDSAWHRCQLALPEGAKKRCRRNCKRGSLSDTAENDGTARLVFATKVKQGVGAQTPAATSN